VAFVKSDEFENLPFPAGCPPLVLSVFQYVI
jgi:hypothetical protein